MTTTLHTKRKLRPTPPRSQNQTQMTSSQMSYTSLTQEQYDQIVEDQKSLDARLGLSWPRDINEWICGRQTSSRGRGIFARKMIPEGTRIWIGEPHITVKSALPAGTKHDEDDSSHQEDELGHETDESSYEEDESGHERDEYLNEEESSPEEKMNKVKQITETIALWRADPKLHVYGDLWLNLTSRMLRNRALASRDQLQRLRFDNNCFSYITEDGQSRELIFLHMSWINHSCRPNVVFSTNDIDIEGIYRNVGALHARTDIRAGQEILTDYLPNHFDTLGTRREKRQEEMRANWEFTCTCLACQEPVHAKSNELRIGKLYQKLQRLGELQLEDYRGPLSTLLNESRWVADELLLRSKDEGFVDEVTIGGLQYLARFAVRLATHQPSSTTTKRESLRCALKYLGEALKIRGNRSGIDSRGYKEERVEYDALSRKCDEDTPATPDVPVAPVNGALFYSEVTPPRHTQTTEQPAASDIPVSLRQTAPPQSIPCASNASRADASNHDLPPADDDTQADEPKEEGKKRDRDSNSASPKAEKSLAKKAKRASHGSAHA